jgi:mannitol/fructose-specific phosphotransferase system IIA component (Ntr-type)
MRNLLDALQEGRLIELPTSDKVKALEYLAVIIEAIPDIGTSDIVKDVLERENTANTGIGMGIACPHTRTKTEGELLCSVGWSPAGIDYGAPDGKKVHLVLMYYIPDSQRNVYLKEISGLAKAVIETGGLESIEDLKDIQSVRDILLDWVEISMAKAIPASKARMIKLETKKIEIEAAPVVEPEKISKRLSFIPFSMLVINNEKSMFLSPNQLFAETAEKAPELTKLITDNTELEWNGYVIWVNSSRQFSMNRALYECMAVK